jgi:hypothetical protein
MQSILYTINNNWFELFRTNKTGVFTFEVTLAAPTLIDWGDGQTEVISSGTINHTYAQAGEKQIRLREGAKQVSRLVTNNQGLTVARLSRLTNFAMALQLNSNPNLTSVTVPVTSNVISLGLQIYSSGLTGTFDMRDMPNVQGGIQLYSNPNLTQVLFAPHAPGVVLGDLKINDCNLTGELDVSMLTGFNTSSFIHVQNNPNLTNVKFAPTNISTGEIRAQNTGITGVWDLSKVEFGGVLFLQSNPNLTGVTFRASTRTFTAFYIISCPNLETLDLRGLSGLGGNIQLNGNSKMTSCLMPTIAGGAPAITNLTLASCNLTGTLDLRGLPHLSTSFNVSGNPNLTQVLFPTTANAITSVFNLSSCNLTGTLDLSPLTGNMGRIDIMNNKLLTSITWPNKMTLYSTAFFLNNNGLNVAFPFGTRIRTTSGEIRIQDNLMSTANVDATIANIYNSKDDWATYAKVLRIHGSNQAAGGVYQAPSGYVQGGSDGTPVSAKEQAFVLVNQTTTGSTKKYNWTITTN